MFLTPEQIIQWANGLMWPFVRISAVLIAAPIFGAQGISTQVRLSLALLLAVLIAPQLPPLPTIDPLSPNGLVILFIQVLIGLTIGFLLQMVFSAVTQAGEIVALSMGLGFASVIDPNAGVQVPIVSQFFVIIATLIFLALDGHLALIELLLDSFKTFPIAESSLTVENLWTLISFGSDMFTAALLIALPAVAALLVVNLAMGVVARAAPQLNIFAVGFPVMMMVGFLLLLLLLPGILTGLKELLTASFGLMRHFLRM
ncbi:flagellar biosynthetic protein FliR [Thiospirillum jenense]|uniref:Flagellar biosynthetic protein FliR n=1 Tax=Thiospirillum jenense TaxID=1653858 RepID=A0A839H8R0_9GAMM|nr:flagellar biosynthetic protein FliR [Thiospirillum jenense]MBB1125773.1 flagellar biosynthetic protein FliR [Thiospirillum jenense]